MLNFTQTNTSVDVCGKKGSFCEKDYFHCNLFYFFPPAPVSYNRRDEGKSCHNAKKNLLLPTNEYKYFTETLHLRVFYMFALYLKKIAVLEDFNLFIVAIVSQIQGFCLQSIWIWQFFGKFVKICKNSYYLGHIYVVIYSESSNNTCDIDICVKLSTVKTCVWFGSCQNGKYFLNLRVLFFLFHPYPQFLWFSKFQQLLSKCEIEAVFSPYSRQMWHFLRKNYSEKVPQLSPVSSWHHNWVVTYIGLKLCIYLPNNFLNFIKHPLQKQLKIHISYQCS